MATHAIANTPNVLPTIHEFNNSLQQLLECGAECLSEVLVVYIFPEIELNLIGDDHVRTWSSMASFTRVFSLGAIAKRRSSPLIAIQSTREKRNSSSHLQQLFPFTPRIYHVDYLVQLSGASDCLCVMSDHVVSACPVTLSFEYAS